VDLGALLINLPVNMQLITSSWKISFGYDWKLRRALKSSSS
jgi:hypothetical protein